MKTIYLEVKDYLRENLERKRTGERLPAESELCKMFKVSRVPVRRAMEDLVKEGVVYRKKGKGTFVRKVPAQQREMNFTVVLPKGDREIPFYASVCTGAIAKATELGAGTFILENGKSLVHRLKPSPEVGIIWIAPIGDDTQILEELRERGCQVLILNRVMKNSHFNYISTDHKQGARDVTLYLLDKGHKKIGFIGRGKINPAFVQRHEGFLEAFRLRGAKSPDEIKGYVNADDLRSSPDPKFLLTEMFSRYSPTALFISAGNFVGPVLTWMKDMHLRVPEHLDIATFDEVPPSYEEKRSIHEVIQPLTEMGMLAVEQMREVLLGKKNLVRIVLPPSIKYKTEPIHTEVQNV